jgi:hypothetical protein
MELDQKNTRLNILPRLLLLLAVLCVAPPLRAQESARMIITAHTDGIYPAQTSKFEQDPRKLFEEELQRLKQDNPDALLVEAGDFLSLSYGIETAYGHPAMKLRHEMEYDVVNLAARDAAMGIVNEVGYHVASDEIRKPLISGIKSSEPKDLGLSPASDLKGGGELPLRFLSLPRIENTSGIVGKTPYMSPVKPAELAWQLQDARRQSRVVVALAELKNGELDELSPEAAPDVVVALDGREPGAVAKEGNTWFVGAPALGQIMLLDLSRDSSGALQEPEAELVQYLEPAQTQDIYEFPIPRLGYPVPNIEGVVETFFSVDSSSMRVDHVPLKELDKLTTLPNPAVYHLELDGRELRLYRIYSQMAVMRDGAPRIDPAWPIMDMMVAIDGNHRVERVLNRTRFPVGLAPTALTESLNLLAGKAPEDWTPDPETTAGIEELWLWATTNMRRAIEMDTMLYGTNGMLVTKDKARR